MLKITAQHVIKIYLNRFLFLIQILVVVFVVVVMVGGPIKHCHMLLQMEYVMNHVTHTWQVMSV
ncbi:hypothetical protein DRJ54_01835 [Candidatus Acetothermia bacterium]|nr:MAG: hypothetical protein DRJ54_01835 [Candidatus Acetothermia bacterium]